MVVTVASAVLTKAEYTLDLSRLMEPGERYVVKLTDWEHASALIAAVKLVAPSKGAMWDPADPMWEDSYVEHSGGVAYFPDLNNEDDCYLTYGDINTASDEGYIIVDFEELVVEAEPLEEVDMSVDALLSALLKQE